MNTKGNYQYDYPRPLVSVDAIIIDKKNKSKILLIKRKNFPFQNKWALPGGFIEMNETLDESILREVFEETGLILDEIYQFSTYGDPGRDPRDRCITIVFYAFVDNEIDIRADDDAKEIGWFDLNNLPELAFDHKKIIFDFIKKLL